MSCTQLLLPTSGCLSIWPPEGLLHHLKACAETTLTQTKKLVPGHFQQHQQQQQAHTVLSFTSLQPEEKALRWDRTLLLGQTLMNSGRGRNHTDREAERSRQVWSTCGLLLNKNMIDHKKCIIHRPALWLYCYRDPRWPQGFHSTFQPLRMLKEPFRVLCSDTKLGRHEWHSMFLCFMKKKRRKDPVLKIWKCTSMFNCITLFKQNINKYRIINNVFIHVNFVVVTHLLPVEFTVIFHSICWYVF